MGQAMRVAGLKTSLSESAVRTQSCTLWHTPAIQQFMGLRQEDRNLKACLGYGVSLILAWAI